MDMAMTPPHGSAAARRADGDHRSARAGNGSAGAHEGTRPRPGADAFTASQARAEDQRPRPVGVEATGALVAAALLWALQLLPAALIELAMTGGGEGTLAGIQDSLESMHFFQSPVWVVAPAAVLVALFAVRQLKPRPIEGQLFLLPVLAVVVYGLAGEIALNILEPGISLGGPLFIMMSAMLDAPIVVLLVAIGYTLWSTAPQRARRGRRTAVED